MTNVVCVISNDFAARQKYILTQLDKLKIHRLDILSLDQNPITIAQIRRLKVFVNQKPFASPAKAVIISGEFLTVISQQALLKTLEEPPAHTYIYLGVASIDTLLPTVVSRCHPVYLPNNSKLETDTEKLIKNDAFWKTIARQNIADRLIMGNEFVKNREETSEWLTGQIYHFRQLLLASYTQKTGEFSPLVLAKLIRLLSQTLYLVKNNISLKLAVDQLLIEFPFVKT